MNPLHSSHRGLEFNTPHFFIVVVNCGIHEGHRRDFQVYLERFMIELFKLNRYSCALKQDAMESNERVLGKSYIYRCVIFGTL